MSDYREYYVYTEKNTWELAPDAPESLCSALREIQNSVAWRNREKMSAMVFSIVCLGNTSCDMYAEWDRMGAWFLYMHDDPLVLRLTADIPISEHTGDRYDWISIAHGRLVAHVSEIVSAHLGGSHV